MLELLTEAPYPVNHYAVTFRRSAPTVLIASVVLVLVAIIAISSSLTSRMLSNGEESSFRLMRDVYRSTLKSTEEKALVRAEIVTAIPAVRMAFIERDRPKLLRECQAMYEEQAEKYGLDQAQFHLPPATSFLRLHQPEAFGDDQSSYRPMLVDVNTTKAPRRGVVVSKAGPAISGIVPVNDDAGKHVGSFEMGLELAPMFDQIKTAYGLEGAVYIDEKMLREVATSLTGSVLSEKNRVGKYMRFYATHAELVHGLVRDGDIEIRDPVSYTREIAGVPWGVQLMPLYNYNNKQIGIVALADDFSDSRAAEGRTRVWLWLTGLIGIVLLSGVILVIIRGLLLTPLAAINDRLGALLRGESAKLPDPPEAYCDELRTLAGHYETIRSARQP